ncbi:MAG: biotin/lipoate--protein ligase family protein [Stappiaceae bacterium]
MRNLAPTFPPLLTGHKLASDKNLPNWAKARAADRRLGAGDLVWSEDADNLHFALVLEPDVSRERCPEILFVAMVAIGDAIGALSPPELSIMYQWPSIILANEAELGRLDLSISHTETDAIPDWMVLRVDLRIKPDRRHEDPGKNAAQTNLWEEGAGDLSRTALLESTSRHLVNLIHSWSDGGFKPIHEQWWGRRSQKKPMPVELMADDSRMLLGMDEYGNALLKQAQGNGVLSTLDALKTLRSNKDADS